MRILPVALVASVVIHTGAIAWALAHKIDAPQLVTVAEPPPIEIETVAPREISVALLDDHTIATIPHLATGSTTKIGPTKTNRSSAVATSMGGGTGGTNTETQPNKPSSGLMTMRHPEISKGPSEAFWKKFEDATKPLQPNPIEGERIEEDLETATEHLNNSRWIANSTPEEIYAERVKLVAIREELAHHELKPDGTGTKATHATFNGDVEADGTAHIEQKRRYDPTEIVMNRHNIDPYASNKLRFLDGTRDERYQIGKRYKQKLLSQSAVIAQNNLAYLWAHTTEPAERKEALFEMWDECAETGADALVAGGKAARSMIVGFIRAHLTGATAYTAEELATFNANKKSSAVFDPYNE